MLNRLATRWLLPALAVLFMFQAIPAHAAWTVQQLAWRHMGRGDLGFSENGTVTATSTPVAPRGSDTLYVSAAPARSDTTTEWSMLDCDNYPNWIVAADDSVASAFFIIQADSGVASTVDFKNTTIQFQVNYGTGVGWQAVNGTAYPHNFTASAKIVTQPIFSHLSGLVDKDAMAEPGGASTGGTGAIFAPRMRAIVAWGTAAAVPQAAIFIKKYISQTVVDKVGGSYAPINR